MRVMFQTFKSFEAEYEREYRAIKKSVFAGLLEAGEGLKKMSRDQVVAAGLGRALANTIRDISYNNEGINPAVLVYSRAPFIIRAFNEGTLIRPIKGTWLAIPTKNVAKYLGRSRTTPARLLRDSWRSQKMRFVPVDAETALIVAKGVKVQRKKRADEIFSSVTSARAQKKETVLFVLKKQIKMPKKLSFELLGKFWAEQIPSLIEKQWLVEVDYLSPPFARKRFRSDRD